MASKTPARIAADVMEANYGEGSEWAEANEHGESGWTLAQVESDITSGEVEALIAAGIDADRAQQAAELQEIAERARIRDYPFHGDGEPCIRAMTTLDCPLNHRYGRTAESAH